MTMEHQKPNTETEGIDSSDSSSTDLLGKPLERLEEGRLLKTGQMLRSIHGQYFEVIACCRSEVSLIGPTGDEEHWSWDDVEHHLHEPSFA